MFVEDNSIYSIFGYNLIVNLEIKKACFRLLLKFIYLILIPIVFNIMYVAWKNLKWPWFLSNQIQIFKEGYFKYYQGMRQFVIIFLYFVRLIFSIILYHWRRWYYILTTCKFLLAVLGRVKIFVCILVDTL